MSEKSDWYEFKIALFDNGEPEEFFLFVRNFKMILEASKTRAANVKLYYMCMLSSG